MSNELVVRLPTSPRATDLQATLDASGDGARASFDKGAKAPGAHLYLDGYPPYAVTLRGPASEALAGWKDRYVLVVFPGARPVRRRLAAIAIGAAPVTPPPAAPGWLDLTEGRAGAAPLFLLGNGTFSTNHDVQSGLGAKDALVNAARWISTRRTSTFERLFAPDLFHPEKPARTDRLTPAQAQGLLAQLDGALAAAAVTGPAAQQDGEGAAQLRSACLTVLSHLVATVLKDGTLRAVADAAAARMFALVDAEHGPAARGALRAHAILLLSQRAPALGANDRARAQTLVKTLVREAPPYQDKDLAGAWNFALCNADSFHDGECEILKTTHGFKEVPLPDGTPKPPTQWYSYRCLEAPFQTPGKQPIRILAREAQPSDENYEMASGFFCGVMLNRHAQLGSFDMRATSIATKQAGYKLMMNSQCAGLTTRFALTRMFPDADIFSSWDSTYFRTEHGGESGKVIASEGMDCFVALLKGMAASETFAQISERMRRAQWYHEQASSQTGYAQFVGPSHPLVVARFSDVNNDGKADLYDGFLDFSLRAIAEDVYSSAKPRDPGVSASQIGGEAARGLGWAAGSMDRVTQYSDIWAGLPGKAELFYSFTAGGFYSHREPPADVPVAPAPVEDLGLLPAVCRYGKDDGPGGLRGEIMVHAWLSHAGKEYKRLLCAAEAFWRAFDLGHMPKAGALATPLGQRGALLLTLAGLLEFPADQNYLDALWAAALHQLNLPDISRSVVRGCITEADHDASNYYGSLRGLTQLIGDGKVATGDLGRADAVAYAKLKTDDVTVGRAKALVLDGKPLVA